MPAWFRKLIFDILGPMLLATPSDERQKMKQDDKNKSYYMSKVQGNPYEIHRSQNHLVVSIPKITGMKDGEAETERKCFHTSPMGSNLSLTPSDERMEEIVYGMRAIVSHLKDTQESDAKINDWHHAAAVLDIAFFWITAITILGSTLAFYFMIPNWCVTHIVRSLKKNSVHLFLRIILLKKQTNERLIEPRDAGIKNKQGGDGGSGCQWRMLLWRSSNWNEKITPRP